MKFVKKFFFLITIPIGLLSCATLPFQEAHHEWTRNLSPNSKYLDYHLQPTGPIIHKKLVIQGNASGQLVAFSRKWGRRQWSLKIPGGVTSPILKVKSLAYFGSGTGKFYCVDLDKKEILWISSLNSAVTGKPRNFKGVLYVVTENDVLYAISEKTGQNLWLYVHKNTPLVKI